MLRSGFLAFVLTSALLLATLYNSVEAAPLFHLPPPEPCYDSTGYPALSFPFPFLHWAPDSSRLVLSYKGRIYEVDADRPRLQLIVDTRPPITRYEWYASVGLITDKNAELYDSPRQKQWLEQQYEANRIYADLSPDSSRLVYSTCHLATGMVRPLYYHEIAVWNFNEAQQERITANAHFDGYPAWAPDGIHFAYVTAGFFQGSGMLNIGRYSVSVEERLRLTPSVRLGSQRTWTIFSRPRYDESPVAYFPPQWSPDGSHIAFLAAAPYSGSRTVLHTISPKGGKPVRLYDALSLPAWSPDGQRIAIVGPPEGAPFLYTMRPDGSDVILIAILSDQNSGRWDWARQPSWSPDGSQILFFTDYRPSYGLASHLLYVVNADGSGLRRVVDDLVAAAKWSPDGSRIAIIGEDDSLNTILYTILPDGSGRQILARARGQDLVAESYVPSVLDLWTPAN